MRKSITKILVTKCSLTILNIGVDRGIIMTKKSNHRENYKTKNCRWKRSLLDLSASSIRNYGQAVKLYEEFHGMSMDNLIKEALEEQSERVAEHELKIYDRILDFRDHLLEQGRMATGVSSYITRIKTLYKKNRVTIPYLPPINQITATRRAVIKFEDYLTKDEIKQGIQYLPLIQQGRVLAMVTGGLSNEECKNLRTYEDFILPLFDYHKKEDPIEALRWLAKSDNVLWIICIKRGKTGKPFYAIMNPECVAKTAQGKLEEVKALPFGKLPRKLDKRLYPTDKNYFGECCRRINDGLDFGYVGQKEFTATTDENGSFTINKLEYDNFRLIVDGERVYRDSYQKEILGDKIIITIKDRNKKITYRTGGLSRFRPHMFRKFHATAVRGNYHIGDNSLSPMEIDELQGRGMTSVQDTYIKANPLKQKFLYAQIINNVSLWHKYDFRVVDDDVDLIVVDDEEKNKKLEKENKKLRRQLENSQDIKEEVKELISDKGIDEVVDIVSQLLKAS